MRSRPHCWRCIFFHVEYLRASVSAEDPRGALVSAKCPRRSRGALVSAERPRRSRGALISTERPRRSRGGAATRPRKIPARRKYADLVLPSIWIVRVRP